MLDPDVTYGLQYVKKVEPFDKVLQEKCVEHIKILQLNNIRVFNRAISLFNMFRNNYPLCSSALYANVLHSIFIISASVFVRDARYPTPEFLHKVNALDAPEKEQEEERAWRELLRAYQWYLGDELDFELLYFVQNGVLRHKTVEIAIEKFQNDVTRAEREQDMRDAWGLWHNSFDDNGAEIIESLRKAITKHIQSVSMTDIDSSIGLIRELGDDGVADDLIDLYVSSNSGNADRFDIKNSPFGGSVRDPKLLADAANALAKSRGDTQALDMLIEIAERDTFNIYDLPLLAKLDVNEWKDLILKVDGARMQTLVDNLRRIGQLPGGDDGETIYKNSAQALFEIADGSVVRLSRLRRWGLEKSDHSDP